MEDTSYLRGMTYEPDPAQIMDSVKNVGYMVGVADNHIQKMHGDIQNLQKEVRGSSRKPKPKRVDRKLEILQTGEMALVDYYSDGKRTLATCVFGLRGPWKTYRLEIEEENLEMPIFGIYFQGSDTWVIGLIEKMKASYLYDLFIRQGICFETAIPRNVVKTALYEGLAGDIFGTENTIKISALAGWWNGRLQHKEMFMLGIQEDICSFPVQKKTFRHLEYTKETARQYFREMYCIKNEKDRLIVMIYPFIAMVSSIFSKNRNDVSFVLNFIRLSDMDNGRIGCWLKIFNRASFAPLSGNMTEKQLIREIGRMKDEVLLLDATYNEEAYYEKRKKQGSFKKALQLIMGKEQLVMRSNGRVYGGLAAISSEFEPGKEVYNIFCTPDWYQNDDNRFREDEVMERLLSEFCRFAEKNMEDIEERIRKKRGFQDARMTNLAVICDILSLFWGRKGVDFLRSAGFRESPDFASFFKKDMCSDEEFLHLLVKYVRKGAAEFLFAERGTPEEQKNRISYDSDYLWFPLKVFDRILEGTAIERQKNQILMIAKKKRLLFTDAEGLSKRLNIGGGIETYKFRRDTFNSPGLTDIVALGKEKEDAAR